VAVLRLRGLYLALSTLAFAYAMDILFFNKLLGFGGSLFVGRAFARSQKGFVLEVSILFAALAIGVLALRRGQFGRRLVALNDSEIACASMGMNITTTKVIAFTLAAGIAGLGGAMYGGWQHVVSPIDFQMLQSLLVLLIITVGGVGSVAGAFFMALLLALNTPLTQHVHIPDLQFILIGVGAVSLGRNPGGMAGQMADATARVQSFRASRRPVPAVPTTGAPTEREDAREHVGV
jgi:branched-chain amino acid transport system permease protein